MSEQPPVPIQHLCAFGECSAFATYAFVEPGIENLKHRNPDRLEVWVCGTHQDAGDVMLQGKIDARSHATVQDLTLRARRNEGKLL